MEEKQRLTDEYYTDIYNSPVGDLLLEADASGITGVRFMGGKFCERGLCGASTQEESPVMTVLKRWLDVYFRGKEPDFTPPLHLTGTPFQLEVWNELKKIPYGTTTTYGAIAEKIAADRGLARMSARAVGTAAGKNKICIVVPCHRVVGADNSLAGFAGGIEKKIALLKLEGAFGNVKTQ